MNNMANFFLSNDSVHIFFSVLVVGFMSQSYGKYREHYVVQHVVVERETFIHQDYYAMLFYVMLKLKGKDKKTKNESQSTRPHRNHLG